MRSPPLSLLFGTVAIPLLAASDSLSGYLQYDRVAISHGQLWRLLTCHFTHWSVSHTFWSTIVFLVLGSICEIKSRRRTGVVVAGSAFAISLAIFLCRPSLQFYRGLSGIDSALYGLLAVMLLEQRPRRTSLTVAIVGALIAFILKISYEAFAAKPVFSSAAAGLVPLPLAHAIGLTFGLGFGLPEFIKPHYKRLRRVWLSRHEICVAPVYESEATWKPLTSRPFAPLPAPAPHVRRRAKAGSAGSVPD